MTGKRREDIGLESSGKGLRNMWVKITLLGRGSLPSLSLYLIMAKGIA